MVENSKKKKIVIFGTGDLAQLANYYFEVDSEYTVVAFTVDKEFMISESYENKPLVSFQDITELYPPKEFSMFVALGYSKMNNLREIKYNEAKLKKYELASYISSNCTYLSQYNCGDNCFIFEDNTVQPYVQIGSNVILWSGNHIGHHSIIRDNVFISSHVVISGHCIINDNCFLGVNATLHNNVEVEKYSLIGAGAVITKNTFEKDVYLPSRSILYSKRSDEIEL